MTNQLYHCGNSLATHFRSSTAVQDGITTSGKFDSAHVASCIRINNVGDFIATMPFMDAASTTSFWFQFEVNPDQGLGGNGARQAAFFSSAGVEVVQFVTNGIGLLKVQYWNGAAFSVLGATFSISATTLTRFTVHIECGASGSINVYSGGSLIFTDLGTGLNAAVTNIARAQLYHAFSSANVYYSQVIAANYDLRDHRYDMQLANGNGANTDGTGGFADISEATLDESTSISLPTTGNKKSFTHPTYTLPSSYQIVEVFIGGRGRINGSGPADGKFELHISSTNYPAAATANFNGGYEPRGYHWALDPSTVAIWTQSGYNAAEFGLEAA